MAVRSNIMINGDLDQFLDTGWYTESTIYYKGHIFWCESDNSLEKR